MGRSDELKWPPLYLVADVATADRLDVDLVDVVDQFVAAGGRMVSLRGPDATDRRLVRLGEQIGEVVRSAGGLFIVHHRRDIAASVGADGLHLSSTGPTGAELDRSSDDDAWLYGRSTHDGAELDEAIDAGADFATLGPVFESVSKPGYGPGLTPGRFSRLIDGLDVTVYALGGVVPDNLEVCLESGADGVGVVGGIVGAESPFEATRGYLEVL